MYAPLILASMLKAVSAPSGHGSSVSHVSVSGLGGGAHGVR